KKLGIHVAHAGIILLLVGQLVTDIFSRETQLHFKEGETKTYTESPSDYELVFTTSADATHNQEISIPASLLEKGGILSDPQLPFSIRVEKYFHNSLPNFRAPMVQNGPPMTTNGVAADFDFVPKPDFKTTDDRNIPTAQIEIIGLNGSLGDWVVSDWISDPTASDGLWQDYAQQFGPYLARTMVSRLTQPQSVQVNGRTFTLTMRPERTHLPFSLTLLKATHSVYAGSDIPKDFRSRVRIQNPQTGEDREVEIYMNTPLRYGGQTFYQYQMSAGELAREEGLTASSVLLVVRNPSWLTPYIGCALVALGLAIQFLSHLIKFLSKRKPGQSAGVGAKTAATPKIESAEDPVLQETVRK